MCGGSLNPAELFIYVPDRSIIVAVILEWARRDVRRWTAQGLVYSPNEKARSGEKFQAHLRNSLPDNMIAHAVGCLGTISITDIG